MDVEAIAVDTIDPLALLMLGLATTMLPFLVVMGTSYVKIIIVFNLLRNALGIQQIPPNMALNAIALVLTMYIMAPVGLACYDILKNHELQVDNLQSIENAINDSIQPYREFLQKHTDERERSFFLSTAEDLWAEEYHYNVHEDNLIILLPSFVVGELTVAFEIGFLLYLPFIVIDLVVSNILMAMGMMMMSPMTISLPFKLLLFVFLDGWQRLVQGLILSYS